MYCLSYCLLELKALVHTIALTLRLVCVGYLQILDEALAAGLLRGLPAEAADVRRRIQLFDTAVQRIATNAEAMGSLHHGLLPLTRSSPPSKAHRKPARAPEVGPQSAAQPTRGSAEGGGAISASSCNSTAAAAHQSTSSRSTAVRISGIGYRVLGKAVGGRVAKRQNS